MGRRGGLQRVRGLERTLGQPAARDTWGQAWKPRARGRAVGHTQGFCLYSEAKGSRECGQVTVEGYHFIFRKLPPWSRRQMTADWGGGGGDVNTEMRWKVGGAV